MELISTALAAEGAAKVPPLTDMEALQAALVRIATDQDVSELELFVLDTGQTLAENLVGALFILVLFWGLGWGTARLVMQLGRRFPADRKPVIQLLAQGTRLLLRGLGAVMALGTLGIDVTALVAGIGLAGFGLSLALKDVISNAVAGVMVLLNKPFRVGDTISVGGDLGVVTDIDLRYTTLAGDGRRILVPNSALFATTVRIEETPAA